MPKIQSALLEATKATAAAAEKNQWGSILQEKTASIWNQQHTIANSQQNIIRSSTPSKLRQRTSRKPPSEHRVDICLFLQWTLNIFTVSTNRTVEETHQRRTATDEQMEGREGGVRRKRQGRTHQRRERRQQRTHQSPEKEATDELTIEGSYSDAGETEGRMKAAAAPNFSEWRHTLIFQSQNVERRKRNGKKAKPLSI